MDRDKWEEAEIGSRANNQLAQGNPETDMTTDDLVMMIGEGAVRERQKDKIIRYCEKIIHQRQADSLKLQSLEASYKQQIEALQKECADARQGDSLSTEAAQKEAVSLRARILHLEEQVHLTAIERDAAIKDARAALDEITALKASKGKKKGN